MAHDNETLSGLQPFRVGEVAGFELGSGPLILALHGWGGRPAQMIALARAVADTGYRVMIPELPGRAGGEMTDIKQASASVSSLIEEVGQPVAVVGHSFAALVMRLALAETAPPSVVLLAPALDVTDALEVFGDKLRLFPWSRRGLRNRLEAWDTALWPVVASVYPDQMPGAEILIVHDPDDDETAFGRATELAALRPDTELVLASGSGHNGILTDDRVLDRVVRFLARESVPG